MDEFANWVTARTYRVILWWILWLFVLPAPAMWLIAHWMRFWGFGK